MNIQGFGTGPLQKTTASLNKMLEKLATAQRINRASDDAAGLAVAEQLSAQVRGFKQAGSNVADAMSALNITDGAATQVEDMMQRQRELAVQSSNGTINNQQRQSLDVEYQQLTQEIDRISGSTNYNRQNVADGSGIASGTAQIQAGANAGEALTLPRVDLSSTALGLNGVSINTATAANAAISRLDTAIQNLGTQRASVGAVTNGLEAIGNNLAVSEANTQAAESVIRDQDMAEGIAKLTSDRLLNEVGMQAFARFNQVSANHVLGLLQ